MLSYRLGTVNDFYWDLKPVFRYSKPQTYPTFIGDATEHNIHLLSQILLHFIYRCVYTTLSSGLDRRNFIILCRTPPAYNTLLLEKFI